MTTPARVKAEPSPEEDAQRAISAALGTVFELGDRLTVHTHAGSTIQGAVEDGNLVGLLMRGDDEKLRFVPFSSMDHALVEEEDGDDEGDDADGDDEAGKAPTDAEIVDDTTPARPRAPLTQVA